MVMANVRIILAVVLMVLVIVAADVLFLRGHFWPRLLVNAAIVAVFAGMYFRFLR